MSNLFAYQRVDSLSVHAADVEAQVLEADQRDDTAAHRAWLLAEADRRRRESREALELQLIGFWPALRLGTRARTFENTLVQDLGAIGRITAQREGSSFTTTLTTTR